MLAPSPSPGSRGVELPFCAWAAPEPGPSSPGWTCAGSQAANGLMKVAHRPRDAAEARPGQDDRSPRCHQPSKGVVTLENTMGRARAKTAPVAAEDPSARRGISMVRARITRRPAADAPQIGHHGLHVPWGTSSAPLGRKVATQLPLRVDQHDGGGVVDQVVLALPFHDGMDQPRLRTRGKGHCEVLVAALNSGSKKAV